MPFARSPRPEVAFACGSRSTTSACSPASARHAARLTAVVVFPTPPFWFAIAKTVLAQPQSSSGRRTLRRGRLRAIPGRLGKPGGVGATLGRTSTPASSSGCAASDSGSRRATAPDPRSARHRAPRRRRAARAAGTIRGHRRRRERLRAAAPTPSASALFLGPAAEHATFGNPAGDALQEVALPPMRLEEGHLRSGRAAASGIPASRRPIRRRRSARSKRARGSARGSPRRERAMRPRRARRSASGPECRAARRASARAARSVTRWLERGKYDHEAVRVGRPRSRVCTPADVLQPLVDELPLDRGHRLELDLGRRTEARSALRSASACSVEARRRSR